MSITRYIGQPLAIVVAFSENPLTVYNKTYADITAISMNFKKNLATDADDAYLERTLADNGVSVNEAEHKFIMEMDEYQNVVVDRYKLVLAIKVDGITDYIEMKLKSDKVTITSDKNRA